MLVLVDGVPRSTPLRDVPRALGMIDLNTRERIEMIAGSSVYGSGATGGTINLITRAAGAPPRDSVRRDLEAFGAVVGQSTLPCASASVSGLHEPSGIDDVANLSGEIGRRTDDGSGDGSGDELASDPLPGQTASSA